MSWRDGDEGSQRSGWPLATYWVRRAVMVEVWGYVSIVRFALRRPRVPAGASAFPYSQPVLPLILVFIVVSAIELVVVDVLVRRWHSVRLGLLVLGIWGLIWMFGLLFGILTRPHAVGPEGIRIRSGAEVDIPLPWDEIETVTHRRRRTQDKQPQICTDADGKRVLHLRSQQETNIDVVLRRPRTVRLAHGRETVSQVSLWADDPQGFVRKATQLHRVTR